MNKYDVTVIGSGPGGYVAAIRCAQLGMKTAIIERYPVLGGTCLHVGCIPSKALLDSSEHYYQAKKNFETHGIGVKGLTVNLEQMMNRKAGVVKANADGTLYLMKKNKIDVYYGHGSFEDSNTIIIAREKKEPQKITSTNIIIATGSKPSVLPGVDPDKKRILSSTEALNLKEIPSHLLVIGGGAIGLELGSVYARLGARVSVVEYMDSILAGMDKSLGKELQKCLSKLGFEFYTGHGVTNVANTGKGVTLKAKSKDGKELSLEGDYCLVSVGRKPYTDKLGLENTAVKADEKGRINVNDRLETDQKNVYAIGDVIRGPMLAHKAEEEGVFVAEIIAGQKPHIAYPLIPGIVYTWPEVAATGATEEELKTKKTAYKSGSFPFKASGRARASMETDGFVKVLADANTDEILGVHMIGPRVADMIAEAVTAMEFRASAEDIGRITHAHPTYSEAFKEACLAASANRALQL
jgi:dihydrolipoamide dehydrogenase